MHLCIFNLKGGVGKTTTAVCTAEALANIDGARVVLVDTDPQASALAWAEGAAEPGPGLRATVLGIPSAEVARRLEALQLGAQHVVLDTPPGDTRIVLGALEASDVAVIPVQPSLMDLDRLRPTLDLASKVGVPTAILLSRVRLGTRSLESAREVLEALELPVLRTMVPQRERVLAAYGTRPSGLALAPFEALVAELSELVG